MKDIETEDALVAHLSEELGLPLANLIEDLQFLRDRLAGIEDEELAEKLEGLISAGELLREVATPLADLARLGRPTSDFRKERFELKEVLESLVRAPGEQPEVNLEVRGELGQLQSDRELLERVLKSLVSAGGSRNRLHLRAHREVHQPCHRVVLAFVFEGVKIGDTGGRRQLANRSLASMLARRLAQIMGGEFRPGPATSDGFSWTLELPVESGEEATPARPVLAFDSTRPGRQRHRITSAAKGKSQAKPVPCILIVDDEPAIVKYMTRILELEGFEVLTAATGEEALQLARTSEPDVITLSLAGGLGPPPRSREEGSLLVALTNDPFLASIPIVVIGADELEEQGELEGVAAFLPKPIDPQDLLDAIQPYVGPGVSPLLLVDSDGERRGRRKRRLELEGFRVLAAENEKVARALLDEAVPALAIVNTGRRKGLSGLAKRLTAGKGRAVPILVLLPSDVTPAAKRWIETKASRVLEYDEASEEAIVDCAYELTMDPESIPDVVG